MIESPLEHCLRFNFVDSKWYFQEQQYFQSSIKARYYTLSWNKVLYHINYQQRYRSLCIYMLAFMVTVMFPTFANLDSFKYYQFIFDVAITHIYANARFVFSTSFLTPNRKFHLSSHFSSVSIKYNVLL
jgi:hypothetical protein